MNAKNLVLVNCVKAIIYLLLYNLHDCTFKNNRNLEKKKKKLYKGNQAGVLLKDL